MRQGVTKLAEFSAWPDRLAIAIPIAIPTKATTSVKKANPIAPELQHCSGSMPSFFDDEPAFVK